MGSKYKSVCVCGKMHKREQVHKRKRENERETSDVIKVHY